MSKRKVLIVDDEPSIIELLQLNLENNGFEVIIAENGEDAIKLAFNNLPDVILLDLMLPGIDGYEVCKVIRANEDTGKVPIIMLTAKGDEADKVIGLELGADDYITKPFGVRELIARIKAVLRRAEDTVGKLDNPNLITIENIVIDTVKSEVTKDGLPLEFTLREFKLLEILAKNRGKVVTRETLLNEIWGYDAESETRTLDVHIRRLRKKIEGNDKYPIYIDTVRGIGYRMK